MEAGRMGAGWTYAEFARLPSEGGGRREVIAGELVVTPAPGISHQRVVTRLTTLLSSFVRRHGIGEVLAGPVDLVFGEGDYLEPDVVVVLNERSHLLSDRGIEGPPNLVIEVASPSTAARDRGVKLDRYRYFGVDEYWIVAPDDEAIEVWKLADGASDPIRYGRHDTLRWAPGNGPALDVRAADVLG